MPSRDLGEDVAISALFIAVVAGVGGFVAGFITHLWWIISILMAGTAIPGGQIVIAIVGVLVPPFGALHGIWLWFH